MSAAEPLLAASAALIHWARARSPVFGNKGRYAETCGCWADHRRTRGELHGISMQARGWQ
jgi:hypothetical protein